MAERFVVFCTNRLFAPGSISLNTEPVTSVKKELLTTPALVMRLMAKSRVYACVPVFPERSSAT